MVLWWARLIQSYLHHLSASLAGSSNQHPQPLVHLYTRYRPLCELLEGHLLHWSPIFLVWCSTTLLPCDHFHFCDNQWIMTISVYFSESLKHKTKPGQPSQLESNFYGNWESAVRYHCLVLLASIRQITSGERYYLRGSLKQVDLLLGEKEWIITWKFSFFKEQ